MNVEILFNWVGIIVVELLLIALILSAKPKRSFWIDFLRFFNGRIKR